MTEINTSGNKLSMWVIQNHDDREALLQVICALAANRSHVFPFHYVLLDLKDVVELGCELEFALGDTPDETCNCQCHRNIIELSAKKLYRLALLVGASNKRERISKGKMEKHLAEAWLAGRYDESKMSSTLLEKLRKLT